MSSTVQNTKSSEVELSADRGRQIYEAAVPVILYIGKRLLYSLLLLLLATFLAFWLAAETYQPLANLLGRNPLPPAATIAAKKAELHLDDNPLLRYVQWLFGSNSDGSWHWGAIAGNFGKTNTDALVSDQIWQRILVSIRLVTIGSVLGVIIGLLIGAYSAIRQYHLFDHLASIVTFVLLATPALVIAPILKWIAVSFNNLIGHQLFQYTGEISADASGSFWSLKNLLDRAQHLAIPTIVLALILFGSYSRYMRGSMLDQLNADYIRTARAKGLRRQQAIFHHGFRTALIPLATLFAFSIGGIIVGATFTERIFGWHGIGEWVIDGINTQDINITTTIVLFSAVSVVVSSFLADIITALLDPRVRTGR